MQVSYVKSLIDIINQKIFGTQSAREKLSVEDAEKVFLLAKKHDFAHLVGEISGNGEKEIALNKIIKRERSLALFRFTQQSLELESLKRILEFNKIDFIPLKGAVIRGLYPEQWMRTSCDIDVLISKNDLDKAEKALIGVGYKKGEVGLHDVSFFSQNNVHVELHFTLVEEGFKTLPALETALINSKKVDGKIFERKLEDKLFIFYHVYHMAKHFMNGGCGIKPFVDLKLIEQRFKVSEKPFNAMLTESGLKPFYNAVKALMAVWFDGAEHSELTLDVEKFILSGGVYGNQKQRAAIKQVKSDGKIKYLLKRLFVGYKELCLSFPSLKKLPFLFPFYQVARWFKLAFGKDRKRILNTVKTNATVTESEKDGVKTLIEQLGLE